LTLRAETDVEFPVVCQKQNMIQEAVIPKGNTEL